MWRGRLCLAVARAKIAEPGVELATPFLLGTTPGVGKMTSVSRALRWAHFRTLLLRHGLPLAESLTLRCHRPWIVGRAVHSRPALFRPGLGPAPEFFALRILGGKVGALLRAMGEVMAVVMNRLSRLRSASPGAGRA